MTTIIFLISGLVIGGFAAWFIASSQKQKQYSQVVTELEKRASGAEARLEELRYQVQQRDTELTQIRSELTAATGPEGTKLEDSEE